MLFTFAGAGYLAAAAGFLAAGFFLTCAVTAIDVIARTQAIMIIFFIISDVYISKYSVGKIMKNPLKEKLRVLSFVQTDRKDTPSVYNGFHP